MSSQPTTEPRDHDEVLENFLFAIDEAADVRAVLEKWCADYPQRADEFRSLLAMGHMLDDIPRNQQEQVPKKLGDFEIVREVARGGMGIVYEAIQSPLQRRVAVKTIRQGRISPALRERFLREQRVLARLHQSHIVPVFAAGREADIEYFAMPFIEGATLQHVIRFSRASGSTHPTGNTPSLSELVRVARAPEPKPATDAAPKTKMERPRMAGSYFRSVAEVMANVAEAIQHAHEAGILHRDIKPSNVMVDSSSQSWIIDFGLARLVRGHFPQPEPTGVSETEPTLTSGVLGTFRYMAPEQFELRADERSDVWGLGATLYELLTFGEIETATLNEEASAMRPRVRQPSKNLADVPKDLECVCVKAMSLDPGHRYQTAGAFGEDLRHWLNDEPTTARPAPTLRRLALWSRRNKGWAAAILAVILAMLIGLGSSVALAIAAERERKAEHRGSLMLQAHALAASRRGAGWSQQAWKQVGDAAAIAKDDALRNLAAETQVGLDATLEKPFEDFGAFSVLFDPQGTRVLMGTTVGLDGRVQGAKLWDRTKQQLTQFDLAAEGPIAFATDGRAVQLVSRPEQRDLALVSLQTGDVARRFPLPAELAQLGHIKTTMTPDGLRVAATVESPEGKAMAVIWDGQTGKQLRCLPVEPGRLALAPDGSVFAIGDEDGHIRVWSVATGEQFASVRASNLDIMSMAFAQDRRSGLDERARSDERTWLLAAGDAGGTVTIWDLAERIPRVYCRGSSYHIFSLAFSPDGMTLAAAGRAAMNLWDVATGRRLLTITPHQNFVYGLAFSPDGRSLATSTVPGGGRVAVTIWSLSPGEAGRELRGLDGQIPQVFISPDGSRLAGLSDNWQLGIWDLKTGFLRCVLRTPKGLFADNAGIAFSSDSRQIAMTTLRAAKLWDVDSARELDAWELPEGRADVLAFDSEGRPISCRFETLAGEPGVFHSSWREHPRVCRIRQLLPGGKTKELATIPDFCVDVRDMAACPQGRYFVIDGYGGPNGLRRMIRAFDPTGRVLFDLPHQLTPEKHGWGSLAVDPSGKLVAALTGPDLQGTLVEMRSMRESNVLRFAPAAIAPGARYWTTIGKPDDGSENGVWLYRRGDEQPVVGFATDRHTACVLPALDPSGDVFAWGNDDGSVTVCNIPQLYRGLAELELEW